jgi:hypothetical protein
MITEETYPATVTSNEDDEFRGRVRVACAALLGDEETELPMWVEPVLDWGWFYIPDVGETIDVVVVSSSDSDENRGQMSIDNLDIRWKGKRYYTVDEPENENTVATPVHPDFKTSYGKRRGFATPHGHTLIFDDTKDAPAVQLTFSKAKLEVGEQVDAANTTRVEIQPDGSLKVNILDKHTLHFQSDNDQLIIGINGGASLTLADKDADATMTVGDGAVGVAIAPALKNYIDTEIKTKFDSHVHPDAMGGTGATATPLEPYDDAITSTKVNIPDG